MKHVKADFAFYLLLAYDFDTIYAILSNFWKDWIIKPQQNVVTALSPLVRNVTKKILVLEKD